MALAFTAMMAAGLAVVPPNPSTAQASRAIPTVYEAGHFYAVPDAVNGQKLRLLVDTGGGGGGGMYWITAEAAKRLGLSTRSCKLGESLLTVADLPNFKVGRGLPPPMSSSCGKALMIQSVPYQGGDGQLGAGYMPGRVWTFDYPAHQLLLRRPSWQPDSGVHAAKLGLANGFARITIQVAGEPIQMLVDTGATSHPTPAGEKASHTPTVGGYGVTSYIDQSVFARWHQAHPTWRVVPKGDDLYGPKLIEVPKVVVASWAVGPVWFTVQSRIAAYMSQYTDVPIQGALGGNVFRHFVMTVDYPHSAAYFQCASDCKPASHQRLSKAKSK
ncbi:MAG: hypothetical protein KGJ97_00415 [Xanthomonadaceae bacterium]|nr:hypothetical protein [Xanthomonadaceae bacterium]MDE3071400.1 hypothetical protein [Pseudomonadota bacterium]